MPYNSHKTCLTNHTGSISDHIAPLVIKSLGGGETHTYTSTRAYWLYRQKQYTVTRQWDICSFLSLDPWKYYIVAMAEKEN